MTLQDFERTIAGMTEEQLLAVSICIAAERHVRKLYPRDRPDALREAYHWAVQHVGVPRGLYET
jgi:hypothetical protein